MMVCRRSRSRRAGDPGCSRREPYPRRTGGMGSYCLIVVMAMTMGVVPWLTVDGNLVAGNDDFSQQRAAVRRCVGGTIARTVGEVRTVVHDDVFAVGVEFGQDSLFSMRVTCAIPSMVARAIVVLAMCCGLWHDDFPVIRASVVDDLFLAATTARRRRRRRARRFRVISRISSREVETGKLARVGGGTLRAAGREVPFDVRRMAKGWTIPHGDCGFRYGLARYRRARDEVA